jgi:hypothetical protein
VGQFGNAGKAAVEIFQGCQRLLDPGRRGVGVAAEMPDYLPPRGLPSLQRLGTRGGLTLGLGNLDALFDQTGAEGAALGFGFGQPLGQRFSLPKQDGESDLRRVVCRPVRRQGGGELGMGAGEIGGHTAAGGFQLAGGFGIPDDGGNP